MFACSSAGQDCPIEKGARVTPLHNTFTDVLQGERGLSCVFREKLVSFLWRKTQQNSNHAFQVAMCRPITKPTSQERFLPAVIARKSCSDSFLVKIFDVVFQTSSIAVKHPNPASRVWQEKWQEFQWRVLLSHYAPFRRVERRLIF
jgi:hypothetical protein